jgi:hypothetical protein
MCRCQNFEGEILLNGLFFNSFFYFYTGVNDRIKNDDNLYIPITKGEFAVLRSCLNVLTHYPWFISFYFSLIKVNLPVLWVKNMCEFFNFCSHVLIICFSGKRLQMLVAIVIWTSHFFCWTKRSCQGFGGTILMQCTFLSVNRIWMKMTTSGQLME